MKVKKRKETIKLHEVKILGISMVTELSGLRKGATAWRTGWARDVAGSL